MYSFEKTMNAALDYFGDELPAQVWVSKYAMKKGEEFLELTPDDMHTRMAIEFAKVEQKYPNSMSQNEIYELFRNFKYVIPQGSVMAILGTEQIASLSNCVVMPEPYDSYGGIMKTDQQLAQLFKRRCGVGTDISTLRPSGARTNNAAQSSTGAVSFAKRYSNTTREVAQNGRRGALMLTMDVRHPDVEDFATSKLDRTQITGANISIKLTDEFMEAVNEEGDFQLRFPVNSPLTEAEMLYNVYAPDLWNTIISAAHDCAEPGLIFWDRQVQYSPTYLYEKYTPISTNPCGEIAMQGGDSCRLIAINMLSFVDKPFTEEATFNWRQWRKVVSQAMRLSDDLVELEIKQIDKIIAKIEGDPEPDDIKQTELETWKLLRDVGLSGRRTGLGITGVADTLAALGFSYDIDGADVLDDIMRVKAEVEFEATIQLARERGAFPDWDKQLDEAASTMMGSYMYMLREEFPHLWEDLLQVGRRNISWSTVAPTGSLSLLAKSLKGYGVSSGLEPVYAVSQVRRRKVNPKDKNVKVDFVDELGDSWQHYEVYHNAYAYAKELGAEMVYEGSQAEEIHWADRLDMQVACQNWTTHSISSTINLSKDVSVEEVKLIYEEAWMKNLKGITVYRDGSRDGVILKTIDKFHQHDAPKRPKTVPVDCYHVRAVGQDWIVVVGLFEGKPYEVFAYPKDEDSPVHKASLHVTKKGQGNYILHNGKKEYGNIAQRMSDEQEAVTRLASLALRHGSDVEHVVETMNKLPGDITSFAKAIGRTLKRYINKSATCQDCGSESVIYEEGCAKCTECGSSKCS